jgi:peptidoglycan/LPS O-acetylase OafA/YrhL
MNKNTSVYLDATRLLAATLVFLGHARAFLFSDTDSWFILSQAREAVAIFFVLSGFVISYVIHEKERDWRSYFVARAARIYSVTIIALVVTIIVDLYTYNVNLSPNVSTDRLLSSVYTPESAFSFIRCISFTNQFWFSHIVFGSNEPYWSLGFEVVYYVLFGLIVFTSGLKRLLCLAGLLCVVGPKIMMYFPLWLLGVAAYLAYQRNVFKASGRATTLIYTMTPLCYIIIWHFMRRNATNMYMPYSLQQELYNMLYYTSIGTIVAINIVSFGKLSENKEVFNVYFVRAVRWCAGGSFTLYLMHQPILALFRGILIRFDLGPSLGVLFAGVTLLLSFLLAELGERRKNLFVQLFRRFVRPAPARSKNLQISPSE